MPYAATQMDLDTIIPSEERQIAYEIIYLQKLKTKNNTDVLDNKRKNKFTDLENEPAVTRVGRGEGGHLGSLGLTGIHCYI